MVALTDVPQSSIGAPIPVVAAGETSATVLYYVETDDPNWDGTSVRTVGPDSGDELIAMVRFETCYAHVLGPPNDEAFSGHPLSDRGLEPYGSFEVQDSSWIRMLERMNRVHPYHDRHGFLEGKRHFVVSFHDSTFECIARGYSVECVYGSLVSCFAEAAAHVT